MQLELDVVTGAPRAAPAVAPPRVLALCFPDLPLQRVLRAREASGRERGPRAPLVIHRDGQVAVCDPEARARGIRAGDVLVQAQAACAELDLVAADDAADRAALEGLAEALLALAPAVEIAWPDALLLDASAAHLFGCDRARGEAVLAERAVAVAADLGLRCRAALASGRAPARALARFGPSAAPVAPDGAAAALGSLPLAALELAPPLARRMAALGLRQVGDLTRLPIETLAHRFGEAGLAAWRIAQGDDPSPLVPHVPAQLPQERLELDAPLESAEPLLFGLKRLCDRAAARLAGRGLGATRLDVVLRLDPAGEERLEIALAAPSSAASRWLLVLRERLGALRLPGAVVGTTLVVAEAAAAGAEQLAIGDHADQLVALETVLARLAARRGEGAMFAARPADRYRPEAAYAAGPFQGKEERCREPSGGSDSLEPVRPTRLLPRPQPLVALGEGGRLTALRVGGRTLSVLELSPAERLAGEWWSDPFDRDYHRARVEGLGECWIFRDAVDGRLWLHGFFD